MKWRPASLNPTLLAGRFRSRPTTPSLRPSARQDYRPLRRRLREQAGATDSSRLVGPEIVKSAESSILKYEVVLVFPLLQGHFQVGRRLIGVLLGYRHIGSHGCNCIRRLSHGDHFTLDFARIVASFALAAHLHLGSSGWVWIGRF